MSMTFADRPHVDLNSLHKTKRNKVELPVRNRPPKCQDLVVTKWEVVSVQTRGVLPSGLFTDLLFPQHTRDLLATGERDGGVFCHNL